MHVVKATKHKLDLDLICHVFLMIYIQIKSYRLIQTNFGIIQQKLRQMEIMKCLLSEETHRQDMTKIQKLIKEQAQHSQNRIRVLTRATSKIMNRQPQSIANLNQQNKYDLSKMMLKPTRIPNSLNHQSYKFKKSRCQSTSIDEINKLYLQKAEKAEQRRHDRLKNEKSIAKELQKQKRKKLRSAKLIRSSRQNTIISKNAYFENKINRVQQQNWKKLMREKQECLHAYKKVQLLKTSELKALRQWKQAKNQYQLNDQRKETFQ